MPKHKGRLTGRRKMRAVVNAILISREKYQKHLMEQNNLICVLIARKEKLEKMEMAGKK